MTCSFTERRLTFVREELPQCKNRDGVGDFGRRGILGDSTAAERMLERQRYPRIVRCEGSVNQNRVTAVVGKRGRGWCGVSRAGRREELAAGSHPRATPTGNGNADGVKAGGELDQKRSEGLSVRGATPTSAEPMGRPRAADRLRPERLLGAPVAFSSASPRGPPDVPVREFGAMSGGFKGSAQ